MEEITLTIQGMTCKGCEVRIRQALEGLPGVHRATVSHQAGEARVEAECGEVQEAELVAAVRRVGAYHPTVRGSATVTRLELRPQGDGFSAWSALAAVGIGIAGSWCWIAPLVLILFAGGASAFASVATYRRVVGPYMGWIHLPGLAALIVAHYYYWRHPQEQGVTAKKSVFWGSTVLSVVMIGYFYVWGVLLYPY